LGCFLAHACKASLKERQRKEAGAQMVDVLEKVRAQKSKKPKIDQEASNTLKDHVISKLLAPSQPTSKPSTSQSTSKASTSQATSIFLSHS